MKFKLNDLVEGNIKLQMVFAFISLSTKKYICGADDGGTKKIQVVFYIDAHILNKIL